MTSINLPTAMLILNLSAFPSWPVAAQERAPPESSAKSVVENVVVRGPISASERQRLNSIWATHGATLSRELPSVKAQIWSVPEEKLDDLLEKVRGGNTGSGKGNSKEGGVAHIDGDVRNLFTSSPSRLELTPAQLQERDRLAAAPSAAEVTVTRLRHDNLSPAILANGFGRTEGLPEPGSFTLNLKPGLEVIATRTSVQTNEKGGYVWLGNVQRVTGDVPSGRQTGSASLIMNGSAVSGLLTLGTDVYTIHPLGDNAIAIVKRDGDRAPDHPAIKMEQPRSLAPQSNVYRASVLDARDTTASTTSTIRVFAIYTEGVSRRAKDPADDIRVAVGAINLSFINSGVPSVKLELVQVRKTEFAESEDIVADAKRAMKRLATRSDLWYKARAESRANIVVLIANYDYPRLPCGWSPMIQADASRAISVVSYDCIFTKNFSLAHEIGHIFGARHDRVDDPDEPFRFGHGFIRPNEWRTIMAYPSQCASACPRIPYWSNPNVMHPDQHVPLGTTEFEHDARVMQEQAARVSRLRN